METLFHLYESSNGSLILKQTHCLKLALVVGKFKKLRISNISGGCKKEAHLEDFSISLYILASTSNIFIDITKFFYDKWLYFSLPTFILQMSFFQNLRYMVVILYFRVRLTVLTLTHCP